MLDKLTAFALLSLIPLGSAPVLDAPPPLDEPWSWQIYSGTGPLDLRIYATYQGNGRGYDAFHLDVIGTIGGSPYSDWATAYDTGAGESLTVYTNDSHMTVQWVWDEDHYVKVGGTPAIRYYYPVYE